MGRGRMTLRASIVLLLLAGCDCGPKPTPDGGTPPQPEALAWPEGARLIVTATTADSATLEWPAALGPVSSYRLTSSLGTRELATTTASLDSLVLGQHHRVSVVAVGTDGTETAPLVAEVAAAPKLDVPDGDISTDFCGANTFLVRGEAIPCEQLAVVTGHVRTRDGVGVPGLRVSVLKHPEWGSTLTQADGLYALAVAAGRHTVQLRAPSFLPLQRQVRAQAGRFAVMPDTVVLRRDEKATAIATATGGLHVATPQQDSDGQRTTAVFIPPGTAAWLKLPDGGTPAAPTLTLRATEATVGATGPQQMPAQLPAATAYTFAADISADEALAAGATGVGFDGQVALYADNFLRYPVGAAIPLGVYDETAGRWDSGPNAAVVQVTAGGGLDVTGDGVADADFPLLQGEQAALAAHFAPGTQLVRSLTTHFSAFDTNSCWVCLGTCEEMGESSAGDVPQCTTCSGSVLRMENQTLSEFVPVAGTGLSLGWHSNRFNVRAAGVDMRLGLLADGGQPEGVKGAFFRLEVAGQRFVLEDADAGVGATARLEWDGKDVFGRTVRGPVPATASMGYGFGAVAVNAVSGTAIVLDYTRPSFGVWPPPGAVQLSATREAAFFLRHRSHALGDWVPRENLGNLTLDVVHGYSEDGTLHVGSGGIVTAAESGAMLRFVAGGGSDTSEDAGADVVLLSSTPAIAAGPQGVYFIEKEARVRLLRPDAGTVTVAGDLNLGFAGDGQPATQGRLNYARLLTLDDEGHLYIGDIENYRIRRVDAVTGLLSTVVGNGERGASPDGTRATEAKLDGLSDLLFGHDGHLYFMADDGVSGSTLRRVENGAVVTVAGGSTAARPPWESRSPRDINFRSGPHWLGQDGEGRLYVAGYDSGEGTSDYVLRRIEADGRVRLLAGAGRSTDAEESDARKTCFSGITGLAVTEDGTAYVGEAGGTGCGLRGPGLRAISPEGDFSLFWGGVRAASSGLKPPDGPVASSQLNQLGDVALGHDGRVYVVHRGPTTTLHEVVLPAGNARRLVPSRDGDEVYAFDAKGRHLKTVSARTGVTLWRFTWGPHGLEALEDFNGDVTTVERDASGRATALRAQDGQRTVLAMDAQGRVTRVTDSEGRSVEAAYKEGTGLLSEWKDANGHATRFEWDAAGNLTAHVNAVGARKAWRKEFGAVVFTSPEGRETTYGREFRFGGVALTTGYPDGTMSSRGYRGGVHNFASTDGTTTQVTMQAGVGGRFGRAVEVPGEVVTRTPSGLEARVTAVRTSSNAPGDFLDVTEEVEEWRINGRLWRSRYDGVAKAYEVTSPTGVTASMALDEKRRPVTVTVPGVLPVTVLYDERGRVKSVTQGNRSLTYGWGANGYLESLKDALNHETRFVTDSTGRVSKVTQPDGKDALLGQDAKGNLTSFTPADAGVHRYGYSAVDEVTSSTPPALPGVQPETSNYNRDGQVKSAGHSDGTETVVMRDAFGRTSQVKTPWWTNDVTYDAEGRVKTLTRGTQGLEWRYDGFLVMEEKATGVAPATVGWTYDSDFRVASQELNRVGLTSSYDDDSRLTQRGPVVLTYYPGKAQLESVTIGVVKTTYVWNEYGELSGITTSVSGVPLYSEGIQYDAAGRITLVEELVQGAPVQWVYDSDAMGRLTSAAKNGAAASTWTYDGSGNRISENGVLSSYDAQDRLLSRGATVYAWDALGGRASKTEGGATTRYVHDGMGALQSATLPDGTALSYDFDGRQRRVAKRRNGLVEKRWVHDGQYRVLAELDGAGTVTSRFVYASQGHSPDALVRGGSTYAYVKNHLGSVRLVVDAATGTVRQVLDYDAWGEVVADSAAGFQPIGFAGGVRDADTGLTHFGYRELDTRAGVWTAADPLRWGAGSSLVSAPRLTRNAIGIPGYAYAASNPLSFLDPLGLWVFNFGLTGSAQLIVGAEISVQMSLDGHGNLGLSITPNYRVGLNIGAAVGPSALWSPTADTIHEMQGAGFGFAADLGPVSAGICGALPMVDNGTVDWNAPVSSTNLGISISAGLGVQLGLTLEGGYTFVPISVNTKGPWW